jgi:phosphoserine phosphatase
VRGLVVVDLDGTLIPGNSFHAWLFYLGRWAVLSAHPMIALRLARLCLRRGTGSVTHSDLKHGVLLLSSAVPAARVEEFSRRLARTVRPSVKALVRDAAHDGRAVVLATAAPAIYLGAVSAEIEATTTVGTPSPGVGPWRETKGEAKLARVLAEFGPQAAIDLVITDHHDDLPLVRHSARALIVNPSPESWRAFAGAGVPVKRLEVSP